MLQKHTTASLVFIAAFFLADCIQGQRVGRFDAQVKILSSPERTAFGTARALRTRMRHMGKKRAVFGGELDFTTPYFLHASKLNSDSFFILLISLICGFHLLNRLKCTSMPFHVILVTFIGRENERLDWQISRAIYHLDLRML